MTCRVELVADRFVRREDGSWMDLATGCVADLVIESWSPRGTRADAIGERCPLDAMRVLGETSSWLLDCGRVGTDLWFEARAAAAGPRLADAIADAVRTRARHASALAEVASRGIRVVRASPPVPGTELILGSEIASRFRRMGIVPLRADVELAAGMVVALARRHLAVICYDERGEARAAEWIRRLSGHAWRGHWLVDLRPAGTRSRHLADMVRSAEMVRERSHAFGERAPEALPGRAADVQVDRAISCVKRGRHAAGERWLRAAIGSGRRRGDEVAQAEAARHLVERLIVRDDWPGATALALDQLARFKSWHARAAAGDLAARVLIATGDLRRAEGLVESLCAEATVLSQSLPDEISLRRAQSRFWQGRFEEAQTALGVPDAPGPELALWQTLISWANGHGEFSDVLPHVPAAEAGGWILKSFAQACRIEALIADGQQAAAAEAIGPTVGAGAPLDLALLEWLRSRCASDQAPAHGAAQAARLFIQRTRADGITRWGLGRRGMHLLHAIPALLHIVHDAEDDIALLAHGTAWIRAHAGAESAAVLTVDGSRVVSGACFTARDLEHELVREAVRAEHHRAVAASGEIVITTPIVLSGTTIGLLVVRGPSAVAGTLSEAATIVASLCGPALRSRLDALGHAEVSRSLIAEILGRSPAIQALREGIARAAATSFPVLIEGESGTGKELVARAVHRLSARRDRRFCAINCAALTDELVEAELFGHTRGAFTGAVAPRAGLFEEAHHGTLFLDEIGELSARAQAKLLRVLQEREIRRVGDNVSRPVDVRIVAATNRLLTDASSGGLFRDDLRFRLAVVKFRVPALRERLEDVPILADAFWRQATAEVDKHVTLGPDAVVALCRHAWPGNVRELQNAMSALAVIAPSRGRVTARHVQQILADPVPGAAGTSLEDARRSLERRLVAAALARHAGRRADAARELGLSRQGLIKAIKRLGVETTRGVA